MSRGFAPVCKENSKSINEAEMGKQVWPILLRVGSYLFFHFHIWQAERNPGRIGCSMGNAQI